MSKRRICVINRAFCFLFVQLVLTMSSIQAYAQSDTTVPSVKSIVLSNTEVDAPGSIEIIADVRDDISGVKSCSMYFRAKEAPDASIGVNLSNKYWDKSTLSYRPYEDGKWHGIISVDEYAAAGEVSLYNVHVCDNVENYKIYFASEIKDTIGTISYVVKNNQENSIVPTYIGNINSELIFFDLKQNDSGAYYLTGQIVVVEWVCGVSTVPKDTPIMTFKSTDGTEEIEVFVTPTGTNTYYFDRFIEGLTLDKEYVFEITSGTDANHSPNRSMNVSLATSPQIPSIKNLGKIGEQKISYYQADNGELRLYRRNTTYVGNINSELIKTELVKGPNGNYVSGKIVVVEWENGVSTVPFETPIMYFKSKDGLESLPVFVTPTGTNTYYFDRSLGDMDTSKEYVFIIASGDEFNVSQYRSMTVTTAAMENKEGLLWQSDTQYVRYRTDPNTGELRIYAVNK